MPVDYSKVAKFVTPIQIQRQLSGITHFVCYWWFSFTDGKISAHKSSLKLTSVHNTLVQPKKTFIRIKLIKSLLKQICWKVLTCIYIIIKHCKTRHYLLDKTNIKKKLTLPFFKRYVASELIISARDRWHPKMFAAPWFWLIWFLSIILLFVTLLLNSHGSSHYLSVTSHASSFCASGCNCSASHSEQHEGVVNISLNYFVRIKSWLIVNTFSKYCWAYLQGFLFP